MQWGAAGAAKRARIMAEGERSWLYIFRCCELFWGTSWSMNAMHAAEEFIA